MTITVLILSRDRPIQLADMVESIFERTKEVRVIICDNASTQPEMIQLLEGLEKYCTVIRNRDNLIFEGLNRGFRLVRDQFFVISDPDIILNPEMPRDWPERIVYAMQNNTAAKIGVALKTDYPDSPYLDKHIKMLEKDHWAVQTSLEGISDPCYVAAIDTTFAMYRADTFTHWRKGRNLMFGPSQGLYPTRTTVQFYNPLYSTPLRIGGKYIAEHGGWYANPRYYPDYDYYRHTCATGLSSALLNTAYLIDIIRDGSLEKKKKLADYKLPKDFGPKHPKWSVPSFRNRYKLYQSEMGLG